MEVKLFTILVAVSWFTFVLSNSMSQDSPSGNQDEGGGRVRGAPGLFPPVFNLATRARITSNATCGDTQSEVYCRLVEHVPDPRIDFPQCGVCNLNSRRAKERHPIEHAIDGTRKWWQSPSIANGMQYHYVTVTLDLGQVFEVAYVILKAANSPRPGNWILEKSIDGVNFEPWQYYAISGGECLRMYGKVEATKMESFASDDEATCTTYYSSLEPLRDGEIHTSLINGRPSALNPSRELMEFMSARFIRLRFQRIRTLNADLMSPLFNTPENTTDTIVARRYFYSIKDISVGGHCICNGHALECVAHTSTSPNQPVMRCVCQHNTCGESCNQCCPGYSQKRWKQGDYQRSFACEACNCHNHADDCYYDPVVESEGRSLDAEFVYSGGGVCIDCRDHTTGVNCERCRDGYYRTEGVLPEYPVPCTECNCDPVGTIPYLKDPTILTPCVKDDRQIDIGVMPGSCACKVGYGGMKCSQCARGYRGYPNCEPCPCNAAGSINEDPCQGPCICKPNVEGDFCDRCISGTFNLNERDPLGCTMCFCFGVTTHCTSAPWPVEKVSSMDNWFLTRLDMMGYAYPRRISTYAILADHETTSLELASQEYYFMAPKEYIDNKLTAYGGVFQFTLSWRTNYDVPASNITRKVVLILEGHNSRLARWFFRNPLKREDTISFIMTEDSWHHIPRSANPLQSTPGPPEGTPVGQAEFMNVIRGIRRFLIGARQYPPQISVLLKDVSMDVVMEESRSPELLMTVEKCSCPSTYEGLSCERCKEGFRRSDGPIYGGDCEICDCHGHSNTCDDYTGDCLNCQNGTFGPRCESCATGYYGDATDVSSGGCHRCACPLMETSNNFSPSCVAEEGAGEYICDRCPMGYEGDKCERCEDGYFGNPLLLGDYCKPCFVNCHGNVDPSAFGNCDPVTGECLRCINHTAGANCQRCEDGYYGDASNGGSCRACNCDVHGSTSDVCDTSTGLCPCHENVVGELCDGCENGYWNLSSGNGCQSCDCDPTGSVNHLCEVTTGQCNCKDGVTGLRCDQCLIGYWNFSEDGCHVCDCDRGQCDPVTGECICPPNTIGPACRDCPPDTWMPDVLKGCMPCNCSEVGSFQPNCDKETGQCRCREQYLGQSCDRCPMGFMGFPECQRCKCNVFGTDPSTCRGKKCECSNEGQCLCKENIRGLRCNKCEKGFFGLESQTSTECRRCFCFGITSDCSQAHYVYSKLKLDSESASQIYVSDFNMTSASSDGVAASPVDAVTNVTHVAMLLNTSDVYWNLPSRLSVGSKVTSYGGSLKYKVLLTDFVGHNLYPASSIPYLILVSSEGVRLDGTMVMKERGDAVLVFKIDLLEEDFVFHGTSVHPSREEFMMVLAQLNAILVRVNVVQNAQTVILSKVSLDVGISESPSYDSVQAAAVEQCRCPRGYTGTSCEKCSEGYVRVSVGPFLGTCQPCKCNRHGDMCEEGTGICIDCRDNTTGPRCEFCAPGFYGDATQGKSVDCKKCACPLSLPQNNFSPTCTLSLDDGRYNCTACSKGYEGRFCERCEDGYFGDPLTPNGMCYPCECSELGSLSATCDKPNGLCQCKEGVSGDKCNQCPDGFTLRVDGCVACTEDPCSIVLLEELDRMVTSYNISVNVSSSVAIPWSRYYALENLTSLAVSSGDVLDSKLSVVRARARSLSKALNKRKEHAENLMAQMEEADSRSQSGYISSRSTYRRGRKLERNVTELMKLLNDSYDGLHSQMEDEMKIPTASNDELLRRAADALSEIRERNFTNDTRLAMEEHRLSRLSRLQAFSSVVGLGDLKEAIQDITQSFTNLRERVGDLLNWSEISDKEWQKSLFLNNNSMTFQNSLERYSRTIELIVEMTRKNFSLAADLNNSSRSLISLANSTFQEFVAEQRNLSRQLISLVEASSELISSTSELTEIVHQAAIHSSDLKNSSIFLESLLQPTKHIADNALRAARAYSDIVRAIEGAENASLIATMAADGAYNETFLEEDRRLTEVALATRLVSEGQVSDVAAAEDRISSLKRDIRQSKKSVKRLQKKLTKEEMWLQKIISALPPLEERTSFFEAKNVSSAATEVFNRSSLMGKEADSHVAKLSELEQNLDVVSEDAINAKNFSESARSKVMSARETVENVYSVTSFLDNKAGVISRSGSNVKADINKLRRKIKMAKNEVSKIKLSLHSSGNCSRLYRTSSTPSSYNSLAFMVSISKANNQLFYIGGNGSDFFSVETIDYQVIFKWNIGSGPGVVSSTVIMDPGKWYRIEATRISHTGYLQVQDTESPTESPPVSASAPVGTTILDLDKSSVMFIGGVPTKHKLSVVSTQNFEGCMGEMIFDGYPIGLWNFESIEGDCRACPPSPKVQQEEKGYGFDGSGYSMIPAPSSFIRDIIYIAFELRTLSQDALIFFMSSADQVDFISIELRHGKVVSKLDLGEGVGVGESEDMINDNLWHAVSLNIVKNESSLYVDGVKVASAATAVSSDGLTLAPFTKMYIGGVPFDFNMRRDVVTNRFRGCVKKFYLYRTRLNLLKPGQSFGIAQNCIARKVERSVSLAGRGSLALRPVALGHHADITLTFTTLQEDAVILAAGDLQSRKKRDVDFDAVDVSYSIVLVKGLIRVYVNAGQGRLTLETRKSDGKLNDGRPHVILMQKIDKRIRITIDDLSTRTGRLPGTNVLIPARSPLYVGNTKEGTTIPRQVRSLPPFSGCIENLVIMGELLGFNKATEFDNAEIGYCGPLSLPPPQPTDQASLGPSGELMEGPDGFFRTCHSPLEPEFIPYGLRFGITRESYASVEINPTELSKVFTMTIELKTVQQYGMIFYMADRLERNFCSLMLMKGFVLFIFNIGTGSATILTDFAIDDGYWHVIYLTRNRKTGTIQVDGQSKQRVRTIGNASRLNVASPMYVGGLPKDFQTRQIGEEVGSFRGCIRKLELNNQVVDLPNVAIETKGTSLCYTDVETGAFFPGDGYILQETISKLQPELSISLDFKTSANQGVLFGLVNQGSAYIILELKKFAINLRSSNGKETFLVTFNNPPIMSLCNNQWHSVTVRVTAFKLELEVDGNNTVGTHRMLSTTGGRRFLLFAGGMSDDFPLNDWTHYRGCIRDFFFDGSRRDFAEAEEIVRAVPDKCPYF